jgi:hypothetical protein
VADETDLALLRRIDEAAGGVLPLDDLERWLADNRAGLAASRRPAVPFIVRRVRSLLAGRAAGEAGDAQVRAALARMREDVGVVR